MAKRCMGYSGCQGLTPQGKPCDSCKTKNLLAQEPQQWKFERGITLDGYVRPPQGNKHSGIRNTPEMNERLEREWQAHKAQLNNAEKRDEDGNVILTAEQREIGIRIGILAADDVELDESFALPIGTKSALPARTRRKTQDSDEDMTPNELVVEAQSRGCKCIYHGGLLDGFYKNRNGVIHPLRTQQLHTPSKAASRDAGRPITKKDVNAGCHICNKAMMDRGGLMTVDELRPLILQDIAARGITFLEPSQVVSKTRTVEETYYEAA